MIGPMKKEKWGFPLGSCIRIRGISGSDTAAVKWIRSLMFVSDLSPLGVLFLDDDYDWQIQNHSPVRHHCSPMSVSDRIYPSTSFVKQEQVRNLDPFKNHIFNPFLRHVY